MANYNKYKQGNHPQGYGGNKAQAKAKFQQGGQQPPRPATATPAPSGGNENEKMERTATRVATEILAKKDFATSDNVEQLKAHCTKRFDDAFGEIGALKKLRTEDSPAAASRDDEREPRALREFRPVMEEVTGLVIDWESPKKGTITFNEAKQGGAFAEFCQKAESRLTAYPALQQRIRRVSRIAAQNAPSEWQEVSTFLGDLEAAAKSNANVVPTYQMTNPQREYIYEFVAAFLLTELKCCQNFGAILVAVALSTIDIRIMAPSEVKKMMADPSACPRLAKIHRELHDSFVNEAPLAETKPDLFALNTTEFTAFNVSKAQDAKVLANPCFMHRTKEAGKCEIAFV